MKKPSKNELALKYLKELGFPLSNIRLSFSKLTGISHLDMARILGVSRGCITLYLNGYRGRPEIQERIAQIWQVPRKELFPEELKEVCL